MLIPRKYFTFSSGALKEKNQKSFSVNHAKKQIIIINSVVTDSNDDNNEEI
jgi:hypothetical protein